MFGMARFIDQERRKQMSKKVKCIECENVMFFYLPSIVNADNYEYAKHCLTVATRRCVCAWSNKEKSLNNEQYCKHFEKRTSLYSNEKRIEGLKTAIEEYEKQLVCI